MSITLRQGSISWSNWLFRSLLGWGWSGVYKALFLGVAGGKGRHNWCVYNSMWFRVHLSQLITCVLRLIVSIVLHGKILVNLEAWLSHPVVKANVFLNTYLRNRKNKAQGTEVWTSAKQWIYFWWGTSVFVTYSKSYSLFSLLLFSKSGDPSDKRFFKGEAIPQVWVEKVWELGNGLFLQLFGYLIQMRECLPYSMYFAVSVKFIWFFASSPNNHNYVCCCWGCYCASLATLPRDAHQWSSVIRA